MITSRQNPRVKEIARLLRQAAARREAGVLVVEGRRLAAEALASSRPVRTLLITPEAEQREELACLVARAPDSEHPAPEKCKDRDNIGPATKIRRSTAEKSIDER